MDIKLVCFDMDGVIFRQPNFWLELHKKLGTYEEGKELTDKYLKTDYDKLVHEVVGRLWKGKSAHGYYELITAAEYFPGVKETMAELRKAGIDTAIITSGPKDLALRAKDELEVGHVFANELVIKDETISGEFIASLGFGGIEKVEVIKNLTSELLLLPSQVAYVGDNDNDILISDKVGMSIAFCANSEQLRKMVTHVVDDPDLKKILPLIFS